MVKKITDTRNPKLPSSTEGLKKPRFSRLLLTLVLMMVSTPLIELADSAFGPATGGIVITITFSMVLVASVLAIGEGSRQVRITFIATVLCIILSFIANSSDASAVTVLKDGLTCLLLFYIVALISRFLLRQKRVTGDLIAASLCAYLLLGLSWAHIYSIVAYTDPVSFKFSDAIVSDDARMRFGNRHTGTTIYFSFVALTTLGFGDISPVSTTARMLTITEALMGQIYLLVLVSRLVSLNVTESQDQNK